MKILRAALVCAVAMSANAANAPPAELPTFKPGMWSFSLTSNRYGEKEPHVRTMTRCADPGSEIRKKWQDLADRACHFSPLIREGSKWSYDASCNDQGRAVTFKSVIMVDKDNTYRAETLAHTQTQASREIVVARRVGDCPKNPPAPQVASH